VSGTGTAVPYPYSGNAATGCAATIRRHSFGDSLKFCGNFDLRAWGESFALQKHSLTSKHGFSTLIL
jgi:hypothetical protein